MSRRTLTIAILLLAVVRGSTGSHDTGEEETCQLTETQRKTPIEVRPMVFLRGQLYAMIDSSDEELMSNSTVWRIICQPNTTILTIVLQMNLTNGDYLQVKRKHLEGCVDLPWTNHFSKKSILVATAQPSNETADGSTFQLGYLCVGRSSQNLADEIFFNDEVLWYLKEHGTEAFYKAAELITVPESILYAYQNEHSRTILNIINRPGRVPPAASS